MGAAIRIGFALGAALYATGCATTQAPPDPVSWGRIDCRGSMDSAEVATQFEQARLVCTHRAEAARVAGTASIPTGYGFGGAIASGIQAGIAGAQITSATVNSCMAEYGFLHARQSEHIARCPAPPPPVPVTPAPRRSRK